MPVIFSPPAMRRRDRIFGCSRARLRSMRPRARSPSFRSCSTPINPSSPHLWHVAWSCWRSQRDFVNQEQLVRVLIAIGQEGLSVEGLFVDESDERRSDARLVSQRERAGDPSSYSQRALEPWTGGADVTVTTMREGPAFPDLGGTTTEPEAIVAPSNSLLRVSAPCRARRSAGQSSVRVGRPSPSSQDLAEPAPPWASWSDSATTWSCPAVTAHTPPSTSLKLQGPIPPAA